MSTFKHTTPYKFPQLERVTKKGRRWYKTPTGELYPSVTTVLDAIEKPGLEAWKLAVGAKKADKIKKEAAERGTLVHEICEQYVLNNDIEQLIEENDDAIGIMFNKIKPRLKKVGVVHGVELQMYSDKLGLAGTADLICEYNGVLSVVDFKTSTNNKEKDSDQVQQYFAQAAAYAYMFYEHTGLFPEQAVIIMASEKAPLSLIFKGDTEEGLPNIIKAKKLFYKKINK